MILYVVDLNINETKVACCLVAKERTMVAFEDMYCRLNRLLFNTQDAASVPKPHSSALHCVCALETADYILKIIILVYFYSNDFQSATR